MLSRVAFERQQVMSPESVEKTRSYSASTIGMIRLPAASDFKRLTRCKNAAERAVIAACGKFLDGHELLPVTFLHPRTVLVRRPLPGSPFIVRRP